MTEKFKIENICCIGAGYVGGPTMSVIAKKVGNYDWIIGTNGDSHRDTLMTFITKDALQSLIKFNTEALGLSSVYKEHLVK